MTAAAPEAPRALKEQLAIGGVMIVPVGRSGANQDVVRVRRSEEGYSCDRLLPVRFVPLVEGIAEGA